MSEANSTKKPYRLLPWILGGVSVFAAAGVLLAVWAASEAWRAPVDTAIRQYGKLPELPEKDKLLPGVGTAPPSRVLVKHLEEVIAFDRGAGVIWPGALLQGDTLAAKRFSPIEIRPTDRAPLRLTLQGLVGLESVMAEVPDPDNASVQQAINSLLNQPVRKDKDDSVKVRQPSVLEFSFHRIDDFDYSMLKAGVSTKLARQ